MKYEQQITDSLAEVNREEEEIEDQLTRLTSRHESDLRALTRIFAYDTILESDFLSLSDFLETLLHKAPPPRLASYLSSRCGLAHIPEFHLSSIQKEGTKGIFLFEARVYQEVEVLNLKEHPHHLELTTPTHTYFLHPGYQTSSPLSEKEVHIIKVLIQKLIVCIVVI